MFDNEGRGLMFETEDTLAQAFKTDYGNYSDGFRKAFHQKQHHTTGEQTESMLILSPCLQACPPEHPSSICLIPNAETAYSAGLENVFANRLIMALMITLTS